MRLCADSLNLPGLAKPTPEVIYTGRFKNYKKLNV
jgi:hypothetical protein